MAMFSKDENTALLKFFRERDWVCPSSSCLERIYFPLWHQVREWMKKSRPLLIGVAGGNGSGKSTMVTWLRQLLELNNVRAVSLSVDDFHLTQTERCQLSKTVHPLLQTRSAGTIDVTLMTDTLFQLLHLSNGDEITVPRFSKLMDDREPSDQWWSTRGPIDVILWEGFCISSQAQSNDEITVPVNRLESEQDPNCIWREFVNEQIKRMQLSFDWIDRLIYLSVDTFSEVIANRARTEITMKNKLTNYTPMNQQSLACFLMQYQRMFQSQQSRLPKVADYCVEAKLFSRQC